MTAPAGDPSLAAPEGAAGSALLEARDVHKRFGAVEALAGVTLEVGAGEIVGLLGENGAGKSTLIRTITGVIKPDEGEVRVPQVGAVDSPGRAREAGVRAVFQELSQLGDLTVGENLMLAEDSPRAFRRVSLASCRRYGTTMLERFGATEIDAAARVAALSLSQRQKVEVVKALICEPRLLILDEPTSALSPGDADWVEAHARAVADRGGAVIYITHRLDDALRIADRVVVMRGGRVVGAGGADELTEEEIILAMLGRRVQRLYPPLEPPRAGPGLTVSGLQVGGRLGPIDLELARGEIFGVGAIDGQGQRELFMGLAGALPAAGEIAVAGKPVRHRSPHDALRAGIALVPEDRQREGLLLEHTITDNLVLGILDQVRSRLGLLDRARAGRTAADGAARVELRAKSLGLPAGALSGGNQQKVVLARALLAAPSVLLLFDCTRGVDVGTKAEIFRLIAAAAGEGMTILFFSTDFSELVHMCHRVGVLVAGRFAGMLAREQLSEEGLLRLAVSGSSRDGASPVAGQGAL